MVEKIVEPLMKYSGKLVSIDFVVIHNDAGRMNPKQYVDWLRERDKSLGIAHYYCNRKMIAQVLNTSDIGYHTGDWWSNCRSIGYEVCESLKVSDEDFLANEDVALAQATEDLLFYGLPINSDTVRLHHEFVPTTCPHRSMELHGGTTESVKAYFVQRMQYFSTLGDNVGVILLRLGNYGDKLKLETVIRNRSDSSRSIAQKVIEGEFGNGEERVKRLTEAGYDATEVQEEVNCMMSEEGGESNEDTNNETTKQNSDCRILCGIGESQLYRDDDIETIAAEVIQGDWGNGEERKERLGQAGYDYDVVQAMVNEMLA
jgi:gametolysin